LYVSYFQIPAHFVESMLEVHVKYTALIQSVFNGDQKFIGALDRVRNLVIEYYGTLKYVKVNIFVMRCISDDMAKMWTIFYFIMIIFTTFYGI